MEIRDRVKQFKRLKASEIRPNPANWRTHPQAQQDALRGVLAEVGIAGALLVRKLPEGGYMLIDGHMRADVSPETKWPCLVLDVDEAEAAKLLATYDPISAMAEADSEKLAALLAGIDTDSEALQALLDGLAEDNGILDGLGGEAVEDEVPEPPVVPVTKPGDLWLLGAHRLLCGDSTKAADVARLMNGEKVNVAFTSPPYASQRKYDELSGFKPIQPDEYVAWWEPIQANVDAYLAADGSFFVNIKEHCDDGQRSLYVKDLTIAHVRQWEWLLIDEFIWKNSGTPKKVDRRFKNQWEPIFHLAKSIAFKFKPSAVMIESDRAFTGDGRTLSKHQGVGESINAVIAPHDGMAYPGNVVAVNFDKANGHSAAFPVGLPSFFIKAFSDEGDTIYDPFLGSGTTLIAAEQLNRRCFGMEISPQYCDVVVARWEKLTGKKATCTHAAK